MRISESELEIMKSLWEKSPQNAAELLDSVRREIDWEATTVRTLLQRLVEKGAVRQDGKRRSYTYTPAVSADEYRGASLRRMMEKMFNSSPMEMLCFFVRQEKLSDSEIAELENILREGGEQ